MSHGVTATALHNPRNRSHYLKNRLALSLAGLSLATILAGCEFIVQNVAPTPTLITAGSSQQRPMVAVGFGTLEEAIKVTGRVEAEERQDLFFRAAGRIKNIPVRQGDLVIQGQVLAELETGGLESQVADAEKAFETSELRVFSSEASLAQDRGGARNAVLKAENDVASREHALAASHANARSALLAAENDVASVQVALDNLLAGGSDQQVASAQSAVASANSSYVSSSTSLERLESSSSQTPAAVRAEVATRQAAVDSAAQDLANVQSRGAPATAEARADGERRLEKIEADLATARSAFYQSESDLNDVLNKPTPAERLEAENTFEKARLDHDAAVSGSGSDESKLKAEIVWQEAIRAYNDALVPATDAEIVAAQAAVTDARSALLAAEQALRPGHGVWHQRPGDRRPCGGIPERVLRRTRGRGERAHERPDRPGRSLVRIGTSGGRTRHL